jgi:hypothetical protein
MNEVTTTRALSTELEKLLPNEVKTALIDFQPSMAEAVII